MESFNDYMDMKRWVSGPKSVCFLVAVMSSGILKEKQKLGVTFNSDKLGVIHFSKILKLTMCRASEAWKMDSFKNQVCEV